MDLLCHPLELLVAGDDLEVVDLARLVVLLVRQLQCRLILGGCN